MQRPRHRRSRCHRTIRRTSSVRLMPRLRMPLWAAVAIPAAAYAVRSLLRGNATPELADVVVLGTLLVVLLLAARFGSAAQARRDELTREMNESDGDERAER